MCSESASGDLVLAKEYLSLNDICNYRVDDPFVPTYGPRFIDMYNKPNNVRIQKKVNETCDEDYAANDFSNFNFCQTELDNDRYTPLTSNGAFYVARLFFGIASKKISQHSELKESMKSPSYLKPNYLNSKSVLNEFFTFIMIDDVNMIDSRYQNGEISFQLCIGIFYIFYKLE